MLRLEFNHGGYFYINSTEFIHFMSILINQYLCDCITFDMFYCEYIDKLVSCFTFLHSISRIYFQRCVLKAKEKLEILSLLTTRLSWPADIVLRIWTSSDLQWQSCCVACCARGPQCEYAVLIHAPFSVQSSELSLTVKELLSGRWQRVLVVVSQYGIWLLSQKT